MTDTHPDIEAFEKLMDAMADLDGDVACDLENPETCEACD